MSMFFFIFCTPFFRTIWENRAPLEQKIQLNTKKTKKIISACKQFKGLKIFPPCRWLFKKKAKSTFLTTNIVILFYFFNFLLAEAHSSWIIQIMQLVVLWNHLRCHMIEYCISYDLPQFRLSRTLCKVTKSLFS